MKQSKVIELLKELISIESPYYQEAAIIRHCFRWLENEGFSPNIHRYSEANAVKFDGENLICTLQGQPGGPTICLNGHLDTVPLCDGWSYDPYTPHIEGDRIYGLGAADMKAGCAALMTVFKRLKESVLPWKGTLILALTSDQEGPFSLGANALIEEGFVDRIDCSITAEPSAGFSHADFPVLCLGAKGGFIYQVEFRGKAAHPSSPKGINAAVEAAKFVLECEKLQLESDEVLGSGSLYILDIETGGTPCSVPDFAKVIVHRHIVTKENEESVLREAESLLKNAGVKCDYKINLRPAPSPESRYYKPYTICKDDIYADVMNFAVETVCGKPASIDYLDSIGNFNYFGTRLNTRDGSQPPALIIGPDGGNMHGADEYAVIPTVETTCDILFEFLIQMMR